MDRPGAFRYAKLVYRHLTARQPDFRPFSGSLAVPRQAEFLIGPDRGRPCNLNCWYCEGKLLKKTLQPTIKPLIQLIKDLRGAIPLIVLSGAFTEPTLNPRLIDLLEAIKASGSNFGLHTNGTLLPALEKKQHFISRLVELSTNDDYLTESIDGATPASWARTKRVSNSSLFNSILLGLKILSRLKAKKHASSAIIRTNYLLDNNNFYKVYLGAFVHIMSGLDVDTVRFSIPYPPYMSSEATDRKHREFFEQPLYSKVWPYLMPLLSRGSEKPFIFALPPETQNLSHTSFHHCFAGYAQITVGTHGKIGPCPSTANSSFPTLSLGDLTSSAEEFLLRIQANQNSEFDPKTDCFQLGGVCTRALLEVNQLFEDHYFRGQKVF